MTVKAEGKQVSVTKTVPSNEKCGCGQAPTVFVSMITLNVPVPSWYVHKSFPLCEEHYDAIMSLLSLMGVSAIVDERGALA